MQVPMQANSLPVELLLNLQTRSSGQSEQF